MKKIKSILFSLACILAIAGCEIVEFERFVSEEKDFDEVMIYCAVGRNDLHNYLKNNIKEIQGGYLPGKDSRKAIILVTNLYINGFSAEITCPYAIRLYADSQGAPVLDTLQAWSHEDRLTSTSSLNNILTFVSNNFDSANYGLIYSSHGSGWLPEGYYSIKGNKAMSARRASGQNGPLPYEPEARPEGFPLTKTMGREIYKKNKTEYVYEMTSKGLAEALPFHLQYLVIDACFMGGVEVAYDLKDKCSYIVCSPAEILAEGFNYRNMAARLLNGPEPDLEGLCQDYFDKYKNESGSYRSATISLIDCKEMDGLAAACKPLFEKYRNAIADLDGSNVQAYFVHKDSWFYDLEDILIKAGMDSSEQSVLNSALGKCVIFKAGTEKILDKVELTSFSGLSSYLPSQGTSYLDEYYKTLGWNIATGFVE